MDPKLAARLEKQQEKQRTGESAVEGLGSVADVSNRLDPDLDMWLAVRRSKIQDELKADGIECFQRPRASTLPSVKPTARSFQQVEDQDVRTVCSMPTADVANKQPASDEVSSGTDWSAMMQTNVQESWTDIDLNDEAPISSAEPPLTSSVDEGLDLIDEAESEGWSFDALNIRETKQWTAVGSFFKGLKDSASFQVSDQALKRALPTQDEDPIDFALDEDDRYDFGFGLVRCEGCGAYPRANRGCGDCWLRLCKPCFARHIQFDCYKSGKDSGSVVSTASSNGASRGQTDVDDDRGSGNSSDKPDAWAAHLEAVDPYLFGTQRGWAPLAEELRSCQGYA